MKQAVKMRYQQLHYQHINCDCKWWLWNIHNLQEPRTFTAN